MSISPKTVQGNWDFGIVLDKHSISSEYLGEDVFGNPKYHNTRTELGELIYTLKYRGRYDAIDKIVSLIKYYLVNDSTLNGKFDVILPIPPTKHRDIQPVFLIAEAISNLFNCYYVDNVLIKTSCEQSKNMINKQSIQGTIQQQLPAKRKINVLLVDDIYSTGATANECVKVLRKDKNIDKVYYLAMTYTK
jgi:predicted amidophosphoribosyltransferase